MSNEFEFHWPWDEYRNPSNSFSTWSGVIKPYKENYMYAVMEKNGTVISEKKCSECGKTHNANSGAKYQVVCYVDTLDGAQEIKSRGANRFIRKIKYEEIE